MKERELRCAFISSLGTEKLFKPPLSKCLAFPEHPWNPRELGFSSPSCTGWGSPGAELHLDLLWPFLHRWWSTTSVYHESLVRLKRTASFRRKCWVKDYAKAWSQMPLWVPCSSSSRQLDHLNRGLYNSPHRFGQLTYSKKQILKCKSWGFLHMWKVTTEPWFRIF